MNARAFIRMIRIGEGTGELIKSRDKVTKEIIYIPNDFDKGYTTAFAGNKITDLSTHPQIIYKITQMMPKVLQRQERIKL